jgi:hypothetical protein
MSNQITTQMIVVAQPAIKPSPGIERVALFNPDGSVAGISADTGATVVMTGYTSHAAGAVGATDTLNVAMEKLEARIIALEGA